MEMHALVKVTPRPDGAAARMPVYAGVRRLLVVRDDRLGDLVLTLPALDRLRAAYPDAEVGLLVQPPLAPLAEMFEPVDRVSTVGATLSRTTETIRRFAPDAAVCISRRPHAAWALRRAGVRRITGTGRRWFSPLFDRALERSRRGAPRHELEHALDLAFSAGATPAAVRFPIRVPEDRRAELTVWEEGRGLERPPIVIHPGSGGSCPAWPAGCWRELALELRVAGHPLVLSRGPGDDAALEPFAEDGIPVFDGGLPALTALLERARLVLSNSTGPIHLAAALGRPALAIHAPWRSCGAERWGPWGDACRALVVGRPEGWSRRRRRLHAEALMRGLAVSDVLEVVRKMLENPRLDPETPGCTL